MSKGTNQKLKLFYLAQILQEKTDEEHFITMPEILDELEKHDITAERKSIYSDIKLLNDMGIEVQGEQTGKTYYYHVTGRQFELPELKLLVDAIQSSKFITAKKSNELIKKLETFCSSFEARQLQRQVFVQDRIKTMNESIYYSVDAIHNALNLNRKIKFQYFNWNEKKEPELRHDGKYYCISPWALSWDDENYYLVAFDSEAGKIKHYRVDKMLNLEVTEEKREGRELFEKFNTADYAKKNFGMYSGRDETVTVLVKKSMIGVFVDRFGKDITIIPTDDDHCKIRFSAAVSLQFLGWIFALGEDVKIISPESVVNDAKNMAERLYNQYL